MTTTVPVLTPVATTIPLPSRPYPVSSNVVAIVDPTRPTVSRGRPISATRRLTTDLWYPAVGGAWPLVVFAPGFQVGPDTYAHLLQSWAAAGYVVAAPRFPLSNAAVAGPTLDENDLNNEPADVRFVMRALTAPGGQMADHIDVTRMGVAGHSDGSGVALSVAQQADISIRAVIALAARPVPRRAPNPPILIAQGDVDTINPPARGRALYDQAASPRFLLTLEGAGHLAPFAGDTKWQSTVEQVTIDFLDHYVARTSSSDMSLFADGDKPGLTHLESAP